MKTREDKFAEIQRWVQELARIRFASPDEQIRGWCISEGSGHNFAVISETLVSTRGDCHEGWRLLEDSPDILDGVHEYICAYPVHASA